MGEEDKGFKVKDHRLFDEQGNPRTDSGDQEQEQKESPRDESDRQGQEEPRQAGQERPQRESAGTVLPPVDFASFVIGLVQAAVVHLGQAPDPQTGETQTDLQLARHTIDTIGMLQEKTKGNLTREEQNLIDTALTELRLAYVRLSG